jgi:hypothetical protein
MKTLVYRLYNLTEDEVKVIERDCGAVRFAVSKAEWEGDWGGQGIMKRKIDKVMYRLYDLIEEV